MGRVVSVAAVLMIAVACANAQVPSCREVARMIAPCVAYLAGRAVAPYGLCCGGVVALNRTVLTVPDRTSVCACLKTIAPRLPILNIARAAILPRACGVDLNVTISPSIDCDT
ncbi:Non-specific lipid-transfer protein 2 [Apostasia shenzhenica]|uniref:Non-specific lipid-transfer protein n=1 Tax=Apostasia shenzhenica TaxID=1088818 RepID=A0A2I0ATW5_9ASPA|nr:Non-specific lipid-transfer protein 2 [Apostasia shenzhenica]